MKNKNLKALLYNFLGFASVYVPSYFIFKMVLNLSGWGLSLASFVMALVLAPKFQYAIVQGEGKIYLRWIFLKTPKEIK